MVSARPERGTNRPEDAENTAAPRILQPLLLAARATDKELVRQVEYVRAENRILWAKLPQRIKVTLAERARLIRLGRRVGAAINHLISIVHPRTFALLA